MLFSISFNKTEKNFGQQQHGSSGLSQAGGGALAPQFLAKQLTLSQPGGQIMPTTVIQAPRIFWPCDGPD